MTKEQLIKENDELKNKIIELQAEIIRLKVNPPTRETIIEKEIDPFYPYDLKEGTTGDLRR